MSISDAEDGTDIGAQPDDTQDMDVDVDQPDEPTQPDAPSADSEDDSSQ